jgi:hypothetical protein
MTERFHVFVRKGRVFWFAGLANRTTAYISRYRSQAKSLDKVQADRAMAVMGEDAEAVRADELLEE